MRKTVYALGLLLAAALPFSCAQNNPDAPDIGGYSTGLTIVKVTAIPDVLPADGVSQSQLRLEARDRDFNPLPGRSVAFFIVGAQASDIDTTGLRYCSNLSGIGTVIVSTGITDAYGIAWGTFEAAVGLTYAEEPSSSYDPNQPPPDPCLEGSGYTKYTSLLFYTTVRGKLTDPRESESEYQIEDDVIIEHYAN